MKRVLLVLGAILILLTGVGAWCGTHREGDSETFDLIANMREEAYFGISQYEASDSELLAFLQDEPNRAFIESTVRQITFGQKVLDPPGHDRTLAEVEFLDYMSDKAIFSGLQEFLNRLTGYSPLGPIVGSLNTLYEGTKVFYRFADILKGKEETFLVHEYVNERRRGNDEEAAYNLTINDPIYEDVVELVLNLRGLKELGKTTEELKREFWDYCEYNYQSWELADNEQKREDIKRYILDWIERERVYPTPTPTIPTAAPWPMFSHDPQHTGRSPYTGPELPSLRWSFQTGDKIYSSPAIGSDGTIYVASDDGNLYALNPDGSLKWSFPTGDDIRSSPAIGSDGAIYVSSDDLYALNPNGSLKWRFQMGGTQSSPTISSDGTIYVGSSDENLYAINPNGSLKWKFDTGDSIAFSSPAIDSKGSIYVSSTDSNLYAISPSGSLKWRLEINMEGASSPAIGPDGTIYVASDDWNLYALDPDGSLKWRFETRDHVRSSPAITSDGTIYVGSSDGNIYAISPNGSLKWSFQISEMADQTRSSPAIGADETVYIGSEDGRLYALSEATQGLLPTPTPKSAEQQVKELIIRGTEAWNKRDWRTAYEMMSPNYRNTASYQEFKEYSETQWEEFILRFGTAEGELEDIKVKVDGEWAYATYRVWIGGAGIDLAKAGEEDIYRKIGSNWYDVAEFRFNPGCNEEDLPPGFEGGW